MHSQFLFAICTPIIHEPTAKRPSRHYPGARILIQLSYLHPSWVDLLTDLKNMAVCQEWNKQDFNFQNVYLENVFMQ